MKLRSLRAPLQLAVTAGLLALAWRMTGGALLDRLAAADPVWVAAGLGFGALSMVGGAARWAFTARSLGTELGATHSLREFYLSVFLNLVLPGLAGDVLRAWRHGRHFAGEERGGMGPAARAVIIERLANQLVISLLMLGSLALWPWMPGAFASTRLWLPLVGAAALAVGSLTAVAVLARRRGGGLIEDFLRDSRDALLGRRALLAQIGLGVLITGSCVAMFGCAARAVGAPLSLFHLLALVPGSLLAMSIPISIGGWGLREASAMALWTMAGLPASDAMATSVLYGLLVLVGALPGAVVLAVDR